jgi:hypothetical protein
MKIATLAIITAIETSGFAEVTSIGPERTVNVCMPPTVDSDSLLRSVRQSDNVRGDRRKDPVALHREILSRRILDRELVHEIAHILEGVVRLSENGIMKAHFNGEDHARMAWKPLQFAPEDVALIEVGLARRARKLATFNKLGVVESGVELPKEAHDTGAVAAD